MLASPLADSIALTLAVPTTLPFVPDIDTVVLALVYTGIDPIVLTVVLLILANALSIINTKSFSWTPNVPTNSFTWT